MTRKGLVVTVLVAALLLVGSGIVLSARPIFEAAARGNLQWRVEVSDQVAVDATQEQRFDVQDAAKLNKVSIILDILNP